MQDRKMVSFAAAIFCMLGCGGRQTNFTVPQHWPVTQQDIPHGIRPAVRRSIEKVFAPKPEERELAARALGRMKTDAVPAIPFLVQLSDDRSEVRKPGSPLDIFDEPPTVGHAAFDAIIQIGKAAVPALVAVESAETTPKEIRWRAIAALGRIADAAALDCLLAASKDGDRDIRGVAARSLAKFNGPRVRTRLVALANDRNEEQSIRFEVVGALCGSKDPGTADLLLGFLHDKELRNAVLGRRIGCKDERLLEPFLAALHDPEERIGACYSLSYLGNSRGLDALLAIMEDGKENPAYRIAAATGIARSGTGKAIDRLISLIEKERGPEFSVAADFARMLAFSRDECALDRLFAALRQDDLAERAAGGLRSVSAPGAVKRLIAVVTDRKPYPVAMTKVYACMALLRIRDPQTIDAMIGVLDDQTREIGDRFLAISVLQRFDDPRGVPAIMRALEDGHREIRIWGAQALGEIGDSRAINPLTFLARTQDIVVQHEAKAAIEKIKTLSPDD